MYSNNGQEVESGQKLDDELESRCKWDNG